MRSIAPFLSILVLVQAELLVDTKSGNFGLEDDVQFLFKWNSLSNFLSLDDELKKNVELINLKTINNENFKCAVPINTDNQLNFDQSSESDLNRIHTSSLLSEFHQRKLCSYRIESYWIYELCHGNFVRQYHETKTAGKVIISGEYFLGYFDPTKQDPDYFKQSNDKLIPSISWKNLNGVKIPTYAVKYTDGTSCEILKDTKREITIFYACDEFGNDNIVGFEEISSCIYEMIVVSKWICAHPVYKIPEKVHPSISCFSDDDSLTKPLELIKIEAEQSALRADRNKVQMTNNAGQTFVVHYKRVEEEEQNEEKKIEEEVKVEKESSQVINDDAQKRVIKAFLDGQECLTGGTGWWKFEICFGKHVLQYHEDEKTKKRQTILLGTWNEANHIKWINSRPSKRPLESKIQRTHSSLLYSEGDKCDETNKHRLVEVKIKCIRGKANSAAVSLYLIEPYMCEYLLGVESPWLCDYVESVDANGLLEKQSP
ncbi:endoplasmic reticulum lectin 1 isoform X1 [Brachionus plicatilis]|uniref:Endoplasmic reticulum lectin 1 n=1 Tax=Brachionus plicatilis TaxID=10195 RepID=A0A3M7P901_BRAPC|nr:endoplasmic reticulum lectin 1 isoform X1 [Brachionus plicatilis]